MESRRGARRGPKPKADTRSNLVEAGLQMIHAQGYAATGIQSIVEYANVPKGSFYNHFTSKEAFGADVVAAFSDRGQARLRDFLCNAEVAPLARLEAYFDDLIEAYRASNYGRGCLLGNLSAEAADHSALIRESLAKYFRAWNDSIAKCIEEAQEQGTLGNQFSPATLAGFIFNSWEGALLRMRVEKNDTPLIEFKNVIFGKLLV